MVSDAVDDVAAVGSGVVTSVVVPALVVEIEEEDEASEGGRVAG